MIGNGARAAYPWVAWLFVACCLVQVFLAGLGVFESATRFAIHRDFGYAFGLLTIMLIVLAVAGRLGRVVVGLSVLLFVQFVLQSVFVVLRESAPFVAALHPVNGFLILLVGIVAARTAAAERDRRRAVPPAAAAAPGAVA